MYTLLIFSTMGSDQQSNEFRKENENEHKPTEIRKPAHKPVVPDLSDSGAGPPGAARRVCE
jgi:hypothetical protein